LSSSNSVNRRQIETYKEIESLKETVEELKNEIENLREEQVAFFKKKYEVYKNGGIKQLIIYDLIYAALFGHIIK
jgi:DNA-binding protein H-NS